MKKTILILIGLFLVITLSGCKTKEKVLTCKVKNNGENVTAYGEHKYTFNNDKLVKYKLTATFKDFTLPNLSSNWDSLKKQFTEQNKPVEKEGYKRSIKINDKKYIFSVIIEVNYNKVSKETMKKYGIKDYSNKKYKEIKKQMLDSDSKIVCK